MLLIIRIKQILVKIKFENMNKNSLTIAEASQYNPSYGMSFRGVASRDGSREPQSGSESSDSNKPSYQRAISKHCSRKMSKKRDGSSDGGHNSAYMLVKKFKDDIKKKELR